MPMKLKYTKEDAAKWMSEHDGMRIEGADMTEEVFTHQTFGTFAVARIRKSFEQMPAKERAHALVTFPINESIERGVSGYDVDQAHVDRMPIEEARNNPVMYLDTQDGQHILLDGVHRLARLIKEGDKEGFAIIVPWEVGQLFKVRVLYHNIKSGVWEEMPNEMDLAGMMGDFPHHDPKWHAEMEAKLAAYGLK